MVVCEICKKDMKCISNTHLNKHNMTIKEYKDLHPNSKCNWNDGETKETDVRIKNIRDFRDEEWKRKVFTKERNIKISNKLKGKHKTKKHNEKVSDTLKKRKKELGYYFTAETIEKMRNAKRPPSKLKKQISIENIITNLKNIFIYKRNITKTDFLNNVEFNTCSSSKIRTTLRENNISLDDIANDIGIKFEDGNLRWREKENFIQQVIEENGENIIALQKHYKGIGRIDIETKDFIYEVKSYKYLGFKEQKERYNKIGKPVKIIIFEDKGITDVDGVICVKNIIKTEITMQEYNKILRKIPIEQTMLGDEKNGR